MKVAALFLMLIGSSFAATTVEILAGDTRFRTLVNLVKQAKLLDTLNGGTFTIFAPTDDAFKKVPLDALSAITSNRTRLTEVLTYHVIAGSIMSNAVSNELVLNTVNGAGARFNIYDHNGKVTVTAEGAHISEFNKTASNGVIHVIDDVMIPPTGDIVSYVSSNKNLTTLLGLVTQAGIAANLQKDGLTLFAPTDAAFARLSQTQLSALQSDTAELAKVLTYHVVDSTQYSQGLWNKERVDTLLKGTNLVVHFRQHGQVVRINNGKVLTADVGTTNGVVHVIDHVLLPPSTSGIIG